MELETPSANEPRPQSSPNSCPYVTVLYGPEPEAANHSTRVLDLLLVIAKHRKLILAVTGITMVLAIVIVVLLPNTYTATSTILPPQQSQSTAAALLSQLGPLAGLGASQLGIKTSSDTYVEILKSRSLSDAIINRFDLRKVYNVKTYDRARKRLAAESNINASRLGAITITVSDHDSKRCAALANGYVEELHTLSRDLVLTEAGQRRVFFQQQLEQEKEALAAAEVAFQATQERTGLIQLDAQGKAIIEAVARTRAEIAMREVELRTMNTFSTESNPDVIRLKEELVGLRQQLAKLETTSSLGEGNIQVPTQKVPKVALEYLRGLRDLKYHEALFEFLSKQLEIARIDEAKDSVIVQVLDKAIEPERKSGPPRLVIVILLTLTALLVSIVFVLTKNALSKKVSDPDTQYRLDQLRAELLRS